MLKSNDQKYSPVYLYSLSIILPWLFHNNNLVYFIIKYSRAISRINWLSGEKNQCFKDHLCPSLQGDDLPGESVHVSPVSDTDCLSRYIGTLKTRTEMVLETLVSSPLKQLTPLVAQKYFIIQRHRESYKLYIGIFPVYNKNFIMLC
jgi:hypothetical protein